MCVCVHECVLGAGSCACAAVAVAALDTSEFGQSFEIVNDTKDPSKQIGAKDSSAILHLPRGFTHLANMELKRLHKLGKPLRDFHRGILKRMIALDRRVQQGHKGGNQGDSVQLEVFDVSGSSHHGGDEGDGDEGGWGCVVA